MAFLVGKRKQPTISNLPVTLKADGINNKWPQYGLNTVVVRTMNTILFHQLNPLTAETVLFKGCSPLFITAHYVSYAEINFVLKGQTTHMLLLFGDTIIHYTITHLY